MIDQNKISKILPKSEVSEIRPCTSAAKIQFHMLVDSTKEITKRIIDIDAMASLLSDSSHFSNVSQNADLGVVKTIYGSGPAEISILASGRVVVRQTKDEKEAEEILLSLAPLLRKSLFNS